MCGGSRRKVNLVSFVFFATCRGTAASVRWAQFVFKTRLRRAIEAAPGNTQTVVQLAKSSDQLLACAQSLAGVGSSNKTKQELLDFIDNITGACDITDLIIEHWGGAGNGCGYVVERLVVPDYWACVATRECRGREVGVDPLMGVCLPQCWNSYDDGGRVSTSCRQPILERIGLHHERLCGESLPREVYLNFLDPIEILFTALFSVAFSMFSFWLRAAFDHVQDPPRLPDVLAVLFHSAVILHLFLFMLRTLREVNHACRFILMNMPPMFAPFIFSFTQCNLATLSRVWLPTFLAPPRMSEQKVLVQPPRSPQRICLIVGTLPAIVSVLMLASVIVPMIIATFWGWFLYIHITLMSAAVVLVLALGWPVVSFPLYWATFAVKGRWLMRDWLDLYLGNVVLSVGLLLPAAITLFMYTCVATFMLYVTGDISAYHTAVFDHLGFSWPGMPGLAIPPLSVDFFEVVSRIFSMDLLPQQLFEASVSAQLVFTGLSVASSALQVATRKLCSRAEAAAPIEEAPGVEVGKPSQMSDRE